MNSASSLVSDLEHFVARLEELVLEARGSHDDVHDQLMQLTEDARFLNADDVADLLDEVSTALSQMNTGEAAEPGDLLPLVFRLRDASTELRGEVAPSDALPQKTSFLEMDLQDEIAAVLSISEEAERSLNSRVQAGEMPFLVVMRVNPEWLDSLEELLEAEYQVLSYRRQDATARIAAVIVEVVPPDVERAVDRRFSEHSIVKEIAVRPLELSCLRVRHGATEQWYAGLTPITVEIDPASMERIWLLMDGLSPSVDEQVHPVLWQELRRSIAASFTVELQDVLTNMQPSLEEMAIAEGKKIRVTVSGGGAAIGVEIAEPLRKVLFELISNSVLHGIEPPAEREVQGKPEIGSIACYIQSEGQSLSVRITDDGRGLESEPVEHGHGGLERARKIVRERLGGVLRIHSGNTGVTVIIELPALQGVYRGLVVVRHETRMVVPSALIVWAGVVPSSRAVVDTTGARFLRYQRQLIPLVEPEARRPESTPPDESRDRNPRFSMEVPAVVIVRVAGQLVALAAHEIREESVVATSPGGWLRLASGSDEWAVGIALHKLPLGT